MKNLILLFLIIFFFCANAYSQTITSKTTGGNWNDGNTWIGGVVPGENNNVVIDGTVSVTENRSCNNITINAGKNLQNDGGLGWLTLVVKGNLINNGTIRNNPAANEFWIEVQGNVSNNGTWINARTFFPALSNQYISQGTGKIFDTSVRRSTGGGYTSNNGIIYASTDLTFTKGIDLSGYVTGVGTIWGAIDMSGHNLNLITSASIAYGTVKNTNTLSLLNDSRIFDITFEGNTTLKGTGRCDNSNVYFVGSLTVEDTLQNGGGLGWLTVHIDGSLTNNGIIKNSYQGNSLWVEVWGDVNNNGIWNCDRTFFPGKNDQRISQSDGKFFDTEVRRADANGYTFDTGKTIASNHLTFSKSFGLDGTIQGVGSYWGSLDMNGKDLNLINDGRISYGTVKNTNNLTILNDARIFDVTFEGNTVIKGRGRIENSNVYFVGNVMVADTLQNGGGLGWLTVHIDGSLANNGIIKNSYQGNSLWVEVWGDVHNNGIWNCERTFLPAKNVQHLSQTEGKVFDTEIRRTNFSGYTTNTGSLVAASDLTFTKSFGLDGYVPDIGTIWGSLDMNGKNLNLILDGRIAYGIVKNTNTLTLLNEARLYDITYEGNTTIKGTGRIDNSNVFFTGNLIVKDTLQNGGGLGWLTPVVNGDVINYGIVKNSWAGRELWLDVRGSIYNYGSWENRQTYIQTAGADRKIHGAFNTSLNMNKTGEPAAGNIYVDGTFTNLSEINFDYGLNLIIDHGASFINKGTLRGNGSITNNAVFNSTHNLQYYDPLNGGLNAAVTVYDRGSFEKVEATYYCNSYHPEMSSAVKQWWRFNPTGEIGSYTISFTYNDLLLNGNDENTLEVYVSPDSGKTWRKISNPINTVRDASSNTIIVGNQTSPVSENFGDFIISSGGIASIASISAEITGRSDIRVGPPNRYTISYWNNGDAYLEKSIAVLSAFNGIQIKSLITHSKETGLPVEIPIDTTAGYYGDNSEVLFILDELGPKELKQFDVILTATPDAMKTSSPQFITGVELFVGYVLIGFVVDYAIQTGGEACVAYYSDNNPGALESIRTGAQKAADEMITTEGVGTQVVQTAVEELGADIFWPVNVMKNVVKCFGAMARCKEKLPCKSKNPGLFKPSDCDCEADETAAAGVNPNVVCSIKSKGLRKVTSWDPNAKEGPTGFGEQGYTATTSPMSYTILFENKKEATAAAWEIVIVDTLDQNVYDLSSFKFGEMSHSMGTTSLTGNVAKWEFVNIELPPNVTPPEGEGWVKFTVNPKPNLPTATQLKNKATITFDLNKPIETNVAINTLDFDPPVTTPVSLTPLSGVSGVLVSWAVDDGNGSGISNSYVFMCTDDGPYTLAGVSDSGKVVVPVEWAPDVKYSFYILSEDNVGNKEMNPLNILSIVTGVEEENFLPEKFELSQNYPNPFNPTTNINFALPERGHVELKIFNILGEEIVLLLNEVKEAGYYNIQWNAGKFSSGVYLYKVNYNGSSTVKKMILMK